MATDYAGIAEEFRAARKLIQDGDERFICWALRQRKPECGGRQVIQSRLGRYEVLSDWVWQEVLGGGEYPTTTDMRDYRLRWLDALIAEFEGYAKEDSTND